MKKLATFLCLFLCVFGTQAQGTITGFTISPTNPTTSDTVYIYANIQFSSSTCDLDNKSHLVSGFNIEASSHHCVGYLLAICNTIDTFKIDPLPLGDYSFNLNLTHGGTTLPCTATVLSDDDSTFSFTVSPGGIAGLPPQPASVLNIYPNPIQDKINLSSVPDGTLYSLIDVTGKLVKSGAVKSNLIGNLETLPAGLYFLQLETSSGSVVKQITKE